jgi:hypothetical protein
MRFHMPRNASKDEEQQQIKYEVNRPKPLPAGRSNLASIPRISGALFFYFRAPLRKNQNIKHCADPGMFSRGPFRLSARPKKPTSLMRLTL